jgi:hypothetical protein
VLSNISCFAKHFGAAAYVFVVGDSSDNTAAVLREWLALGREGHVLEQGRLEQIEPRRTARIASARNMCMQVVREYYGDFDYLIVCDLDQVLAGPMSHVQFGRAVTWLNKDEKRAGVSANATPRYYDLWALRHSRWCPEDVWHAIWDREPRQSFEIAKFKQVYKRQIRIPNDAAPFRVESAFGGLAIYKWKLVAHAEYIGLDAQGREQAEHVAFHRGVTSRGGELFIFPPLLVQAPQEHLFDPRSATKCLKLHVFAHEMGERWRPLWRSMSHRDPNSLT